MKYNLVDQIWKRNKKKNKKSFYVLPHNFGGESWKSKINKVTNYLKKKGADYQFVTACENNAWLLNIRGHDERYSPIPYCYLLINKNKKINFFVI